MKINNLNIKQEAACQAYIKLGDKSAAYREAGYSCKNKTTKSVNEAASRLFAKSNVKARVEELQAKVASIAEKKFEITSEEMLRHLDILRKARIDEYVELYEFDVPVTVSSGSGKNKTTSTTIEKRVELRLKTFDKLTEDQLKAIEGIKQTKYGIEIKLHGKEWSMEKINKHIGFYEKDNEQKNAFSSDGEFTPEMEARIKVLSEKLKRFTNG